MEVGKHWQIEMPSFAPAFSPAMRDDQGYLQYF